MRGEKQKDDAPYLLQSLANSLPAMSDITLLFSVLGKVLRRQYRLLLLNEQTA